MPPPHASSSAAPSGHGPDKRTMAYESIFGRPSAKPKGPMPPPGAPGYGGMHGAPGLPPQALATSHWVHSQAGAGMMPHAPSPGPPQWYGAGGAPMLPQQQPGMRYPGPPQHMPPMGMGMNMNAGMGMGMGMGMGPGGNMHAPANPMYDDRRISVAPSATSDPRMSFYGSAAEAYGSAAPSPAPSAKGAAHAGHNGAAPAQMGSPAVSVASAAPSQGAPPSTSYPDVPGYRHASNGAYNIAASGSAADYAPTGLQPSPPSRDDDVSPRAPPRLPSIELGPRKNGHGADDIEDESLWFMPQAKRESVDARAKAAAAAAAVGAALREEDEPGQRTPTSPLKDMRGLEHALPGPGQSQATQEPADEERNDYQDYQRQLSMGRQSAASSMYGDGRRRGSFESDAPSVTNSLYTLPGQPSGSSRFYNTGQSGPSGQQGYFGAGAAAAYHPPNFYAPPPGQSRMRTVSSATQAAQGAQGGGYGAATGPSGRFEARSMSAGQSARPGLPIAALSSPHGSIGSQLPGSNTPQHRRGPLVYPALLSRVAEAFRTRVTLAERTKDGLSYTDAFDGREAVDRIAYIIKTTDRNLALLLGRALDAQKFFHDVTYDHRLRDSPNELYQFRVRLTNPFESEGEAFEDAQDGMHTPASLAHANSLRAPSPRSAKSPTRDSPNASLQLPGSSAASVSAMTPDTSVHSTPATSMAPHYRGSTPSQVGVGGKESPAASEEEDALPTGVFTLLTDCYSPTCTRDRLCYSIACPRRLEQQARLNMKPQPVLKRSISRESLGDVKEQGALWADSVSKEILESVSDQERKRQELINEVIYTERDFVRDLEYLRDAWIKPLRSRDIIPEARRDDFVTQVFWNVLEIHAVNAKLAELLSKRQKQQAIVERIGDYLLEMVPHFQPFVKYGAHQLYGKYEFEKEKSSNPAFAKFVEETERLPESRKLELNGYLTKPTTRLARYPLLLESVIKATPDDNPDKQALPKVIKIVREFLTKVNTESGRSENRFNLAQLDQQLVFKQGEAVDLRLRDEQRELVFKGPLKRRGGTQSESGDLQVFLFDHALLMVKAKTVHKHELFKVSRKPIPLELLIVTVYDEVPTGKGNATRPKSIMSRTSTGNRLSGGVPTGSAPKQDQKTGYALTFTYLGRKGYTQTLWASTFVSRRKWFEHIEARQEILRQRSNIFDTMTLSEGFFVGPSKVNCSVPFDFGRRIIYGTDDGVYLSDLRERARPPTKVLPLPGVTQVDVLEEYQILIILAERSVHTFTLDALDPSDPMGSLKRGRRISSHTSFFKAGQCLGRTLVCVVKSSSLSSTIKTLEPIEQNVRGKKQPTFRKLLQGGQETLRVFKEFYIPTESSSIHFLKSKLCVGCTKGFEIVDLETLDTQGLLDPADSNLDFVHRKETVKPIAIYRIDGEFLLCYDEFAFYVNKNGWRSKGNWIIHWEGNPTAFALHHPYVLAFEPSFVEVRHVMTGALHQVITGYNLRCLFADVPPPSGGGGSSSSSASSSQVSLHGGAPGAMAPYAAPGRPSFSGAPGYPGPPGAPQYGPGQVPLNRAQSYNMMAPPPPPPPGYGRSMPGAPPPRPVGPPYGPAGQQMMYPQGPRPGVPFAFTAAAQAPRPPPPRNPVWESVSQSRGQIIFIGDTSVFAIKPSATGGAGATSQSISSAG